MPKPLAYIARVEGRVRQNLGRQNDPITLVSNSVGSLPIHFFVLIFLSTTMRSICHCDSPFAITLSYVVIHLHVGLFALLLASGCDMSVPPKSAANLSTAKNTVVSESDSYPRTVTDGLDRTVFLGSRPQRIVSLAPKN